MYKVKTFYKAHVINEEKKKLLLRSLMAVGKKEFFSMVVSRLGWRQLSRGLCGGRCSAERSGGVPVIFSAGVFPALSVVLP